MPITQLSGPANLTAPSQAYREATLSLVYRLSELTFGSLLAAYSLGFVGLIAAQLAGQSTSGRWVIVLVGTQYALISITFAYLTASFYLTYHTGILTMPQMPLNRLGIDFSLAIVQALFFGFSMLGPWSFPVLLGINFYLTGHRQKNQYKALADVLYNSICKPVGRSDPDNEARFHRGLAKLLRTEFSELSGWGPMGGLIRVFAGTMMAMGLVIGYLVVDFLPLTWPLRDIWTLNSNLIHRQILITFEVLLVTVPITVYGWGVLKRRAKFLEIPLKKADGDLEESGEDRDNKQEQKQTPKMDLQFDDLQKRLKELFPK
jgi:hypothetical protein